MSARPLSLLRYGGAVASVLAATLLCLLLDPILEGHLYYLWFSLALLFAAWYGGFRPCLLALALSLAVVAYFFAPPRYSLAIEGLGHQAAFLTYFAIGLGVLFFSNRLMNGAQRLLEAERRLRDVPAKVAAIERQLADHLADGERADRRLATQHRVTHILARSNDLAEAARPILQTIGQGMEYDAGLFWVVDRQAAVLRCLEVWHQPYVEAARFEQVSRELACPKGTGLPGRVWAADGLVCVLDLAADAELPRASVAGAAGLHGAVGFPVRNGVEFLGVLEFFSRKIGPPDEKLAQMMACIGSQISQFIERREAEGHLREQERERRTARAIQQGLLPRTMPSLPGFAIAARLAPARDVGGDCFDFVPMDAGRERSLGVVVADASGHGMAAALLVSEVRSYVRALATTCSDVGRILELTNRRLAGEAGSDHFVTLCLARIDPGTSSLVYASAGHSPGFVLGPGGKIRAVLPSTGMPLGIDEASEYPRSDPVPLQPGDLVLLFTDGIVEAHSPLGEMFGVDRLLGIVRAGQRGCPRALLDGLFQTVTDFCSPRLQHDDMTAVIIQVEPRPDLQPPAPLR
jgi:serine phosphatase RsbU (regulator of sigma subunit)